MLIEELVMQLESGTIQPYVGPLTDDSEFLERIHNLETMYKMHWFEFVQKFDQHKIEPRSDKERLDFAEWDMLCRRFADQLEDGLEGLTIMASPPTTTDQSEQIEGPSNRAFCFDMLKVIYGPSPHSGSSAQAAGSGPYVFQQR
jgi:hypothetical protein